ncbi:hypothetical protein UFOVP228_58 [uncultured Caudovirales phage]|uniref:Uncharacterized protein n=1 Tax=uncultured Caudovirales phage TaxID=2100421 RepID=A0A6J5T875_9CAUD|nr:hypothetical protein UFOVP47_44 [uncultured Caudovirales phage]CAB5219348.1 hypothetical protein UFOVP228_58 [uncultured Caudovirales phage]
MLTPRFTPDEHQSEAAKIRAALTNLKRRFEDAKRDAYATPEAATAEVHAGQPVPSTGLNRRWDDPQPLTVVTRVDGTVTLVGAETTFDL